MSIKISIITPCYNGENLIADAISSVLAQNRDDIEMIIVDDGSTDGTAAVCARYVSDRIRYIPSENRGAGHARNLGMSLSRGQWIAFLDADDLYIPGVFHETFLRKLDDLFDAGTDILCTPYYKADMVLSEDYREVPAPLPESVPHHMYPNEMWSCLYRRDFLEQNAVRFYEYRKQDIETAFRYRAFSAARKVAVEDSMRFIIQRINPQSNTHTWNHYNLYHIKSLVYLDLFRNTPIEADKPFLMETVSAMLTAYFRLCLKHGYLTEEIHGDMQRMLGEAIAFCGSGKLKLIRAAWFAAGLRKAQLSPKPAAGPRYESDPALTMERLNAFCRRVNHT